MRALIANYRAVVRYVGKQGRISIKVLDVVECHGKTIKKNDSYTIFASYLKFKVDHGDELIIKNYVQEGVDKQEWEVEIISRDKQYADTIQSIKELRKTLCDSKISLKQLWKYRLQQLKLER